MTTIVREALPSDATDIGGVHVRAWQSAYRGGLMPDEYLDSLTVKERANIWSELLQRPLGSRRSMFVAEDVRGTIVGFILVGPNGEENDAVEGAVIALNVDPERWGAGAGTLLLASGTTALKGTGFVRAVLWVHLQNSRARRFYEGQGWWADGMERSQAILGVEVPEVRYTRPLS